MNPELLNQIRERKYEIYDNSIIMGIIERGRNKYLRRSETEIVLYELPEYVINQLSWKKQSLYEWLLPVLMLLSEVVCEDFEMLFDEDPQNWREAYSEVNIN